MTHSETNAILIGLTGPPGVGKTTLADFADYLKLEEIDPSLMEHGFGEVHTIKMRQILGWHGYHGSHNVTDLRAFHQNARQSGEGGQILDQLKKLRAGVFIIDALRHSADVHYFKNELDGFVVSLDAPMDVCEARYITDNNDEKHYNVIGELTGLLPGLPDSESGIAQARQVSWEVSRSEMFEADGILAAMAMADVTIDASQNAQSVVRQATSIFVDRFAAVA